MDEDTELAKLERQFAALQHVLKARMPLVHGEALEQLRNEIVIKINNLKWG